MASSKLMTSSTKNSDLPVPNSSSSITAATTTTTISMGMAEEEDHHHHQLQHQQSSSMNMDDLLNNIYDNTPSPDTENNATDNHKSVEEVWNDIVAGGNDQVRGGPGDAAAAGGGEMTLEDFLHKAVRDDDIRVVGGSVQVGAGVGNYGLELMNNNSIGEGGGSRGGGRGKRRVVEEAVVDKATQQKQRRMIKNRESAARSRERKQAYTVELEALVTKLEEENAQLLREEAEQSKERYKLLMENLIPVVEGRKPPRVLRRMRSASW